MLSTLDQENLINRHASTAARKPLNNNTFKTPFRPHHDENKTGQVGKFNKDQFVTPAPKPANRAPLGVKTANAKAIAFQTPAPQAQQPQKTQRPSTTRKSVKRKIYIAPEPIDTEVNAEDVDEPEIQYAPPPIVPLADPPLDFSGIDETFDCLKPENTRRILIDQYLHSPKDDNGFPLSLKKQQEDYDRSLEEDLKYLLEPQSDTYQDPDVKLLEMIAAGPKVTNPPTQRSAVSTVRARAAANAISDQSTVRKVSHTRLPSVATRETAASRLKRKDVGTERQENTSSRASFQKPAPIYKATIGFPKAKKAPSILPAREKLVQSKTYAEITDPSQLSPRKFVELYGQPPAESEMWFRLMDVEIRERQRNSGEAQVHQSLFGSSDDWELDERLAALTSMDDGDFELELDEIE